MPMDRPPFSVPICLVRSTLVSGALPKIVILCGLDSMARGQPTFRRWSCRFRYTRTGEFIEASYYDMARFAVMADGTLAIDLGQYQPWRLRKCMTHYARRAGVDA
jgi:hypothetical protein